MTCPLIVTVPDFDAGAREIALRFARIAPVPPIVRIEGVCGAGKTNIARRLAPLMQASLIAGDEFATKHESPPAYHECIRRSELDAAIAQALSTHSTLILEAICLDDIAPIERWGRGLVVYIKQLSFNNRDPLWHDGFRLEEDPPKDEPHRSVQFYHMRIRPHENADLIIELPQEGHALRAESFSRHFCFDPPNSTVAERAAAENSR